MTKTSKVFGAFNQGGVPKIACFNNATVPLGVNFDKLIAAMQVFVDRDIVPVWGTPATLVRSTGYLKGAWAIVFLDDADEPDALAYHDLTPDGMPQSKVFVKTTLADHALVSVSASHELVEMLVDPAINLMTTGPDAKLVYAYESADPVEDLDYAVNGVRMSDFVYPSYFEDFHKPGSVRFDHLGKVKRPFEVLSGGYQIVLRNGKWSQVYGSAAKKRAFAKEHRTGHRSEQRKADRLERASEREIVKQRKLKVLRQRAA